MGVDVSYTIRLINSELKTSKDVGMNSCNAANSNAFDSILYASSTIQRTSIPLNLTDFLSEEELDSLKLHSDDEFGMTSETKVVNADLALIIFRKIEQSIRTDAINCLIKDIEIAGSQKESDEKKLLAEQNIIDEYYTLRSDLGFVLGVLEVARALKYQVQFVSECF